MSHIFVYGDWRMVVEYLLHLIGQQSAFRQIKQRMMLTSSKLLHNHCGDVLCNPIKGSENLPFSGDPLGDTLLKSGTIPGPSNSLQDLVSPTHLS